MCGSLPGSLCISLSLKRAAINFQGLNHDALLLFGLLRFQLFSFVVVPRVTANGAHIGSGIGDLLIIDITSRNLRQTVLLSIFEELSVSVHLSAYRSSCVCHLWQADTFACTSAGSAES